MPVPPRLIVTLLVAGPLGLTGCLDFDGSLTMRNQTLRERRDRLEAQVLADRGKLDERDQAMQEQRQLEAKLEMLRELIRKEREAGR